MKKILFAFFVSGLCFSTAAQMPVSNNSIVNVNGSRLLSQFTASLHPAAFSDNWNSGGEAWMETAQRATTAMSISGAVAQLVRFIKPSMFRTGFDVPNLVSTAHTVRTLAGAAALLRTLEGGLKPEAFAEGWDSQRRRWLNTVGLLE